MQVTGDGIAAPQQNDLGLGIELHLHSHLGAESVDKAGGGADGAVQGRRPSG